jgi:hypothetical protein
LSNFTIKGKFAFSGPVYSYFMPYVGYQMVRASSPGAGNAGGDSGLSPTQLQEEIDNVRALEKDRFIFGITGLKRLVPGWFLRADLGLDIIGVGFGLEF